MEAKKRDEGYLLEIEKRNTSPFKEEICIPFGFLSEIAEKYPKKEKKSLPPIQEMTKSLIKAVAEEVNSVTKKEPPVSVEERERRLNICKSCEFFTPNIEELPEKERKRQRCVKCGCFMKFKARLRSQHCPIEKW
jgi:hypothetical protein